MHKKLLVTARWDSEARVWVATSDDIPGLVTEAESLDVLIKRIEAVAPELLEDNAHLLHGADDFRNLLELCVLTELRAVHHAHQMAGFYGKIVEVLSKNGCWFVRHGKGDHEIWHSPITDRNFTVDAGCKSRHTANEVMKQAGIPHKF